MHLGDEVVILWYVLSVGGHNGFFIDLKDRSLISHP
jgi:hypothetical protein